MQNALDSLAIAHQQLKNLAITAIQNDTELEPHVIDSIKAVYATIQAIKAATGL